MKKLLLPITLVALGLTLVFLASQAQRLSERERLLEEVYLSALNETTEAMQSLNMSLEKVLLSRDAAQSIRLLDQAGSMAQDVRRNLSLLPLSHEAMAPTLSFANQMADYTSVLLPLLAREGTLPQSDRDQLKEQQSLCAQLLAQLTLAMQTMTSSALSILPEEAVFSAEASADMRPLEALADADHGMDYPTMIYDGPFSDARFTGEVRGLPEGEITETDALTIARDFVGAERVLSVAAAPNTLGQIPAFGVTVTTTDVQLNLDITRQGGKVLWMMPEHAAFTPTQSADACIAAAEAFLTARGFDPAEPTATQLYDGMCVINFAAMQQDVLLYPDLIKVQVRMDTAEVVGLEANNYWTNHVRRTLPTPALTDDEARARLPEDVTVTRSRLCVIPQLSGEVFCYEFDVRYGDGEYLIYLDAATGQEVDLLKRIQTDTGTLVA